MTSRRDASQEGNWFRVMRLLQESPDITQREIAERLGISLGGVNYCLRALIDRGHVKMQNFQNSRNKLGYVYLLTPKGIAQKSAMTAQFLKHKLYEYEQLKTEIERLEAELGEQSIDPTAESDEPKIKNDQ